MLLIVNADDAGMCHSVNQATIASLERGLVTSASVMVPPPWFAEIAEYAKRHPGYDFGVHLTLTSEWRDYRWGPILGARAVPSLCAPDGCLWPTDELMLAHAQPEEVLAEACAQIDRFIDVGIAPTHLDCHMDVMLLDDRFRIILLDLAENYGLPVRLFSQSVMTGLGAPDFRADARRRGVLFPDTPVAPDAGVDAPEFWSKKLRYLTRGVSLVFVHLGVGGEELLAITNGSDRLEDYRLFGPERLLDDAIRRCGAERIGHRPLREVQRGL